MNDQQRLDKLFQYDELTQELESELLSGKNKKQLVEILRQNTQKALADPAKGPRRLVVLAGLWSHLAQPTAAEQLITLLAHEDDAVREAASESLVAIAELKFDVFFQAAMKRLDGKPPFIPAVAELAFICTELDEARTVEIVAVMLGHREPDVVVAAIHIAGEWGWDEKVATALRSLREDKRRVLVDDEEEGELEITLGELASSVLEALDAVGREATG